MKKHLTFDSYVTERRYNAVVMRLLYYCVVVDLEKEKLHIRTIILSKNILNLLGVACILGLVGPGRLGVIFVALFVLGLRFAPGPFSLSFSVFLFLGQSIPSPRGLPLPQKTGKGQSHLLPPKICSQFVCAEMSYRL